MKLHPWLKTSGTNAICTSLAVAIALTPTLSYAQQTSAAQNQQSPQQNVDPTQAHTALGWTLKGTARVQRENFNLAMGYLQRGKPGDIDLAQKYLLNIVGVSARSGLLDMTLSQKLDGQLTKVQKTNPNWFSDSISTSKIIDAINSAPQQTPTNVATPTFLTPPVTDFPGIFSMPNTAPITPVNSIGIVSSDDQIAKLTQLMNTNPELRGLLWQTALDRLGQTGADIGVNPPAYQTSTTPSVTTVACGTVTTICNILTAGGFLTKDYGPEIAALKNLNYGVPLDSMADDIIAKTVPWSTLLGAVSPVYKGYLTMPTTQGNWGARVADWTPPFAVYVTTYSMIGRLAPLYNYPLGFDDQMAMALIIVALTGAIIPILPTKILDNPTPTAFKDFAFKKLPIVNSIVKAMTKAKEHNISLRAAFVDMLKKNPKYQVTIANGIREMSVPEEAPKAGETEKPTETKKFDPSTQAAADPGGTIDPFKPGGDVPPPVVVPPGPGEPKPTKPSVGNTVGNALQIGSIAMSAAKRALLNTALSSMAGYIAKTNFKAYYDESRKLQDDKFESFLYGGANTTFLKLLILSQSPGKLVLNPTPSFPTPPNTPTTPTTPTKPGTPPAPPAQSASQPATTPGTGGGFPFALTTTTADPKNSPSKAISPGGDPATFIRTLARSLHFCSAEDIKNARALLPTVESLISSKPMLTKMNSWDEMPPEDSHSGILHAYWQTLKNLGTSAASLVGLNHYFRHPNFWPNLSSAVAGKDINMSQANDILLVRDCIGQTKTTAYDAMIKEMITFSSFSESNITTLRSADVFVRLRMGELIEQLIWLNGAPDDDVKDYFKVVQKILAIDSPAFINYFNFYEGSLAKSYFKEDAFARVGYRLANIRYMNLYDPSVLNALRPDAPASLSPLTKQTTVVSPNGTDGIWPIGNPGGVNTSNPFVGKTN